MIIPKMRNKDYKKSLICTCIFFRCRLYKLLRVSAYILEAIVKIKKLNKTIAILLSVVLMVSTLQGISMLPAIAVTAPRSSVEYDFSDQDRFDSELNTFKDNNIPLGTIDEKNYIDKTLLQEESGTVNYAKFVNTGTGSQAKSYGFIIGNPDDNTSNKKYSNITSAKISSAVPGADMANDVYLPCIIYAQDDSNYYGISVWPRKTRFMWATFTIPKTDTSSVRDRSGPTGNALVSSTVGNNSTNYKNGFFNSLTYDDGTGNSVPYTLGTAGIETFVFDINVGITESGTAGSDGITGLTTTGNFSFSFFSGVEEIGDFNVSCSVSQQNAEYCFGVFFPRDTKIDYIKKISAQFDISGYYENQLSDYLEELKVFVESGITRDKYAKVKEYVEYYNSLEDEVKESLDNKYIEDLLSAYDAFQNGAYFYDNFEGASLNWKTAAKWDANDRLWNKLGKLAEPDSLPEQNNDPTADGFWGVLSENGNRALALRRNFVVNESENTNTASWIQNHHYVLYTPKNSHTLSGVNIYSISADMYLDTYAVNSNPSPGFIVYDYNMEREWKGFGIYATADETKLSYACSVYRSDQPELLTPTQFRNTGPDAKLLDSEGNTTVFAQKQWLNITMKYSFVDNAYVITVSGKNVAGQNVSASTLLIADMLQELYIGGMTVADKGVFDNIAISYFDAECMEKLINAIPQPINTSCENAIINAEMAYDKLDSSDKSYVKNKDVLTQARKDYDNLSAAEDALLPGINLIDFEDASVGTKHFKTQTMFVDTDCGLTANPSKSGINTSNTVLAVKNSSQDSANRTLYAIKSTLMGQRAIYTVTGKTYINSDGTQNLLVYDFISSDDWRGVLLWYNKSTKLLNYSTVNKSGANEPTVASSHISLRKNNYQISDAWVSFKFTYTLNDAYFELFTGDDIGAQASSTLGVRSYALISNNTNFTRFAFGAYSGNIAYLDDLSVVFNDTEEYSSAKSYLNTHSYILNLTADTLSNADEAELIAARSAYDNLDKGIKAYLGFVDYKLRVLEEAMVYVKANIHDVPADRNDYNSVFTDSFSTGASRWQNAFKVNSGYIKSVDAKDNNFGKTAIVLGGQQNVIRVKNKFLPDKPQLTMLTYNAYAFTEPTKDAPMRIYISYIDAENWAAVEFFYQYSAEEGRNITYYRTISLTDGGGGAGGWTNITKDKGFDISTGYIECYYNFTDIGGVACTFCDSDNKNEENEQATLKYNFGHKTNRVLAIGSAYGTEICYSDLQATYKQGSWEEENSNIIEVFYTANTFVEPGDVALVQGYNIGSNIVSLDVCRLEDQTTTHGYIDRKSFDYSGVLEKDENSIAPVAPAWNTSNQVLNVKILQKTDVSVKFYIPEEFEPGIYAVRLNFGDAHEIITTYINSPYVDYTVGNDGAIASPGEVMRVIGKNIAPGADDNASLTAKLKALIVGNGYSAYADIAGVQSDYSISVTIPNDIPCNSDGTATEYELWIYNGYGDNTCWSVPTKIQIAKPVRETWNQTVYNFTEYSGSNITDIDSAPVLINLMETVSKNGGGIIYFDEGLYRFGCSIIIPENVQLIGKSLEDVQFMFSSYRMLVNDLPNALIYTSSNVAINNISIWAERAGGCFGIYGTDVKNIYIENVRVQIQPYGGSASDAPQMQTPLLNSGELQLLIKAEKANPMLYTNGKAENVHITDCSFITYGSHRGLVADVGNNYWQVNNVKAQGYWTEVVADNTLWENSSWGPNMCLGVFGHGMYFGNNYLHDQTQNNLELFVGDLTPYWRGYVKLAGNDSYGLKTVYQLKSGSVNTKFIGCQIYITDGNGEGQTRIIQAVDSVNNTITLNRPFSVLPDENTILLIRRPRENMYYIENTYYNGTAGGFFGGLADCIYDGNLHDRSSGFYFSDQGSEVIWYLSVINDEFTYDGFTYHDSFSSVFGEDLSKTGFFIQTGNGNGGRGILYRNAISDGHCIQLQHNAGVKDVILDNVNIVDSEKGIVFAGYLGQMDGWLFNDLYMTDVKTEYSGTITQFGGDVYTSAIKKNNNVGSKILIELENGNSALLGDVNLDGVISLKDCTLIRYVLIGRISLNDAQIKNADIDQDGRITLKDVLTIRYIILYG